MVPFEPFDVQYVLCIQVIMHNARCTYHECSPIVEHCIHIIQGIHWLRSFALKFILTRLFVILINMQIEFLFANA